MMFPTMLVFSSLQRNTFRKLCLENSSKNQIFYQACFRHTGTRPGTLRPLKVTSVNKPTKPLAWTGGSKNHVSQRGREVQFTEVDEMDDDPLENAAYRIGQYSSKHAAHTAEDEHTREVLRSMRFIKFKTIERKFFKKPPSLNLLTWAAKEQIRYLHHTDSEEWSVQMLSELFPVSADIIKLIIKSKVRLFRDEEIIRHDLHVQRNWTHLQKVLENEGIKDYIFHNFKNSQNETIITNAAGIQDLPFPVKNVDKLNPKGKFSLIVQDCYDAKEEARKKMEEELDRHTEQLSTILSAISRIFDLKSLEETVGSDLKKSADVGSTHGAHKTSPAEQLPIGRRQRRLGHVNEARNVQERKQTFTFPKYKESLPTSQPEDEKTRHMRRDVLYKLKVQPDKNSNETKISGDCVYDKNGEFLYRIL